jgi:hypothetical protein
VKKPKKKEGNKMGNMAIWKLNGKEVSEAEWKASPEGQERMRQDALRMQEMAQNAQPQPVSQACNIVTCNSERTLADVKADLKQALQDYLASIQVWKDARANVKTTCMGKDRLRDRVAELRAEKKRMKGENK